VRNVMGEDHDLWGVNTERSYHEDFVTKDGAAGPSAHPHPDFVEA
jgi:hypothetical protein